MNAWIAYLHFICFGVGVALLVSEFWLIRQARKDPAVFKTIGAIDAFYGLAAVGSLVTGLIRAGYTEKGFSYYLNNGFFYAKISAFVIAALISLPPTFYFIRQRGLVVAGQRSLPADSHIRRMQGAMVAQGLLYLLIPLFGVLMARGYGMLSSS